MKPFQNPIPSITYNLIYSKPMPPHSIRFHGIEFHLIYLQYNTKKSYNSIPFNPFHSTPISNPIHFIPIHYFPFHSKPIHSIEIQSKPIKSSTFQCIPFQSNLNPTHSNPRPFVLFRSNPHSGPIQFTPFQSNSFQCHSIPAHSNPLHSIEHFPKYLFRDKTPFYSFKVEDLKFGKAMDKMVERIGKNISS